MKDLMKLLFMPMCSSFYHKVLNFMKKIVFSKFSFTIQLYTAENDIFAWMILSQKIPFSCMGFSISWTLLDWNLFFENPLSCKHKRRNGLRVAGSLKISLQRSHMRSLVNGSHVQWLLCILFMDCLPSTIMSTAPDLTLMFLWTMYCLAFNDSVCKSSTIPACLCFISTKDSH